MRQHGFFFFSSRRRHTSLVSDWSSDVCSSDLMPTSTGGSRTGGIEAHGPNGLRMRLGSGPDAAAEARRALAELRADLDPPLMETLRLLVTELVTNSVRHTECESVMLRIAIGKAAVLTEVVDQGPRFDADAALAAEQMDNRDQDAGWGLFLV